MRYCLTLDLINDPDLIAQYEAWHSPAQIKPEIPLGINQVGILNMEIYRWENRLFMIVDTVEDFDWEGQMGILATLPGQQEWEALMDTFQQRLTDGTVKWQRMTPIFKLTDYD